MHDTNGYLDAIEMLLKPFNCLLLALLTRYMHVSVSWIPTHVTHDTKVLREPDEFWVRQGAPTCKWDVALLLWGLYNACVVLIASFDCYALWLFSRGWWRCTRASSYLWRMRTDCSYSSGWFETRSFAIHAQQSKHIDMTQWLSLWRTATSV